MTEIQGKSILVRVNARFELARVRVIESRLYSKQYVSTCCVFESFSPVHKKTLKRWKYDSTVNAAKREATFGFPIFRTDKPSYVPRFNEESLNLSAFFLTLQVYCQPSYIVHNLAITKIYVQLGQRETQQSDQKIKRRFISFLLPQFRASREMPRSPRLAHKVPVIQANIHRL